MHKGTLASFRSAQMSVSGGGEAKEAEAGSSSQQPASPTDAITHAALDSVKESAVVETKPVGSLSNRHSLPSAEHARTASKPYVSKLQDATAHGSLTNLQATRRVAIKINSSVQVDDILPYALEDFQQRMQRIHGIKIAMALAMRAGCVVLSFSVSDQEGLPDEQLAEICRLITEETQAWAAEHGLLGESRDEGSDLSDFVSIQACATCFDGTHFDECTDGTDERALPDCSLSLLPFLTPTTSPPSDFKPCPEGHEYTSFVAVMKAPAHLKLRGWSGAEDSPEELEDADNSVCLLASMAGQFLPVQVQLVQASSHPAAAPTERQLKVCITLPTGLGEAMHTTHCGMPIVLKVWAAGMLACSSAAMLLPPAQAPVVDELASLMCESEGGVAAETCDVLNDLMEWMLFRLRCLLNTEGPSPEQLQLMADVRRDLLQFSQQEGLCALEGMLHQGLRAAPFCLPPVPEGHQLSTHTAAGVCVSSEGALPYRASVASASTTFTSTGSTRVSSSSSKGFLTCRPSTSKCTMTDSSKGDGAELLTLPSFSPVHSEEHYRLWLAKQNAGLTKAYFAFSTLFFFALLPKVESTTDPLVALILITTPVRLAGIFCATEAPQWVEVLFALNILTYASWRSLIGTGYLMFHPALQKLLRHRIELFVECAIFATIENVRTKWLYPLRVADCVGLALVYSGRGGIHYPWLQAVAVALCSLMVNKVLDIRHKSLYAKSLAPPAAPFKQD